MTTEDSLIPVLLDNAKEDTDQEIVSGDVATTLSVPLPVASCTTFSELDQITFAPITVKHYLPTM